MSVRVFVCSTVCLHTNVLVCVHVCLILCMFGVFDCLRALFRLLVCLFFFALVCLCVCECCVCVVVFVFVCLFLCV